MISQLAAYGPLWLVFPLLVFASARWGGLRGAIGAHLLIGLVIMALEVLWIVNHGLQSPETRVGVAIAIVLRACLSNVILLPVSVVGLLMRGVGPRPVA
jgi:hypothetical protein